MKYHQNVMIYVPTYKQYKLFPVPNQHSTLADRKQVRTRNATALKLADPATHGRARARAIGKPCNHATRARAQTT